MQRELRSRRDPCFDAVCFHAQQCAEKFLKARLTADGITFAKTHSLTALLDQALVVEPLWEVFRTDLHSSRRSVPPCVIPASRQGKKMLASPQRDAAGFERRCG
jgi:hypothetical protein